MIFSSFQGEAGAPGPDGQPGSTGPQVLFE